jgi:Domain of unknown function (DUF397)
VSVEATSQAGEDFSSSGHREFANRIRPHLTDLSAMSWKKSTHSYGNGDCVEAAPFPGGDVALRDSKDKTGPVLRFTPSEWRAFLGGVKGGEFDLLG